MHPTICTIGPFTIYSYGLMLVLGFLIAVWLAMRRAKQEKISPDIIFNLSFLSFISGIAGARLLYIIQYADFYLKNPLEMIMLQHGGLSWFGGLISGAACAFVYLGLKQQPIFKILDLLAPYIALAQAIGRIGCFLNGCCFGKASPYGIYFPVHNAILIPTQAYSSFLLIIIFFILRFLQERPHKQGAILFTYLALYCVKRFFIEFWRADNEALVFGLTIFQLFSVAIFIIAILALIFLKRAKN